MPRYMVRAPYNDTNNPADGINFTEKVRGDDDAEYLWGSTSMLLARNLVRSFETSGWCQYLRGVKGGSRVRPGCPSHMFNVRGEEELRAPIEILDTRLPASRELANAGPHPADPQEGNGGGGLLQRSVHQEEGHRFKDPKDSENSTLVTNDDVHVPRSPESRTT